MYNDLLTELRKDPELSKILDDFPWNDIPVLENEVNNPELSKIPDDFPHMDVDDDGINGLIWNDIIPNDISVLENELNTY